MDTINTKSQKLKKDLYDIIGKSELPAAEVYYILQEVLETFVFLEFLNGSKKDADEISEQK